jgi:hypothetical protein
MIETYWCDESVVDGMTRLFNDVKATGKAIRPGTVGQNKVREDYKKCVDLFFNEIPESGVQYDPAYRDEDYLQFLFKIIREYSVKYLYDEPLEFHSPPKFQFYKPGEAFYADHFDALGVETQNRVVAFITYLNTIKDGGGTSFIFQDTTVKAEKCKTILFPAGYTHRHKGEVSETESKLIITGWFRWKT